MDAILTDSHLGSRIEVCILMNVIVPKLEYAGEMWEGNAKFVTKLETAQMTAAKKSIRIRRVINTWYSIKNRTGNVPT